MNKEIAQNQKTARVNRPLIVSYSYSGNTHRIAQEIQNLTNGIWSEIYPWQPYPMAFPELLEQVKREIESGYKPRLLPGSRSPKHDTIVFVGSPNWCGTIAPPIASWLSKNNLAGKIILPFYSHCGGVPCDFKRDITKLCPKADVRDALSVINDGEGDLTGVFQKWLEKNGVMNMVFAHTQ